ncbi:MAG TPA: hypothetical protein VFS27_11100 [Blastocatellia bacterium]|jgi:hypothetical protein|nr:hypothetical protein [Blastocatellia bacterium]
MRIWKKRVDRAGYPPRRAAKIDPMEVLRARVKLTEAKRMIDALHRRGVRVTLGSGVSTD